VTQGGIPRLGAAGEKTGGAWIPYKPANHLNRKGRSTGKGKQKEGEDVVSEGGEGFSWEGAAKESAKPYLTG